MFIIYKRSLNLVTLILTIVILSVLLIPRGAQASSAACQTYASTAVSQQRENLHRNCGYRGNRWQTNYDNHYNWCVRTSAQSRAFETKARQDALQRCRSSSSSSAACQNYASTAVSQQRENLRRNCGYRGNRWQTNYKNHYNWCVRTSARNRTSETKARQDALRRCTSVKPIEYTVGLKADRRHVRAGEEVRFRGGIRPGSENVRYRFYYGDGERSGWLNKPTARHIYRKPGLHHAYLAATIGERKLRSDEIPIDVSQIEYILHLEAHPPSVLPGEHIEFVVILEPEAPNTKYQFGFGDGETYVESDMPNTVYAYRSPGAYEVSVTATIGHQSLSKTIRVTVQEKADIWILIAAAGGALAVLGGSVYLYRRKLWKSKIKKPTKVVVTMQIKEGQANQNIDKDDLLNDIEVRFRPVGDAGMQEIEEKDNIVDRERSDHE